MACTYYERPKKEENHRRSFDHLKWNFSRYITASYFYKSEWTIGFDNWLNQIRAQIITSVSIEMSSEKFVHSVRIPLFDGNNLRERFRGCYNMYETNQMHRKKSYLDDRRIEKKIYRLTSLISPLSSISLMIGSRPLMYRIWRLGCAFGRSLFMNAAKETNSFWATKIEENYAGVAIMFEQYLGFEDKRQIYKYKFLNELWRISWWLVLRPSADNIANIRSCAKNVKLVSTSMRFFAWMS